MRLRIDETDTNAVTNIHKHMRVVTFYPKILEYTSLA